VKAFKDALISFLIITAIFVGFPQLVSLMNRASDLMMFLSGLGVIVLGALIFAGVSYVWRDINKPPVSK
jgi:hypothetical protein